MRVRIAETFGRYELRGVLGEGGFATVYRAWDPYLGREVALKALLPHLAANEDVRRRFVAEVQSLGRLSHQNIVAVHDAGDEAGRPFFTMELVDGPTLSTSIANGQQLPLDEVAAIMRSLGSAVDYLHAAGLVHRDIKPANVMRDTSGRIVLMDFGIARLIDGTHYTRAGAGLGTPEYMAPEQVQDEDVGPAADIYALGVLAYQLLAGRPPFTGSAAHVMHSQVYDRPPPLRHVRPDLPRQACDAVELALAKEPADRPEWASELAAALESVGAPSSEPTDGGDPAGKSAGVRRARTYPRAFFAGLVLLLLVGALPGALFLLISRRHKAFSSQIAATIAPIATPTVTGTASATVVPTQDPSGQTSPTSADLGACAGGDPGFWPGPTFPFTVRPGESLLQVAASCGIDQPDRDEFARCVALLNNLPTDVGDLQPGQVLDMPKTWPTASGQCPSSFGLAGAPAGSATPVATAPPTRGRPQEAPAAQPRTVAPPEAPTVRATAIRCFVVRNNTVCPYVPP